MDLKSEQSFFRQLSQRLGPHWEPLATYLGLSNDDITCIKQDRRETEEQIFAMLMAWKQNNPSEHCTRETLAKAVVITGRRDLETEILQGYFNQPENHSQTPSNTSGNATLIPDILTEVKLRKLSKKIAGEWKQLATYLGVTYEQVGKINRDYHTVEEKVFQMLMMWKQGETEGLLGRLKTTLREVGRVDLALDLDAMIDMGED